MYNMLEVNPAYMNTSLDTINSAVREVGLVIVVE